MKPEVGSRLRLLIEIADGRVAGATLENGFLDRCLELGAEVHVLSPGACFEPFVERYRVSGTRFSYVSADSGYAARFPRLISYEARLGRWLCRHGLGRVRRGLWQSLGERVTAADGAPWSRIVDETRPDCFVSMDLNGPLGGGLLAMCRRKGIATVGNVFSWDHPYYQQRSRPDHLTCWSPAMRGGLVEMGGFSPRQIEVIGAPVFDPYFDPAGAWTREDLCGRLGLDPARPILLYATLGQIRMFWDETGTFRAFMAALDREKLPGPPQVVLRLHPRSIDHYFDDFRFRDDVVFSRYTRYCPGMRWWPSRDEVVLAGNLLRHADVCISPGSTFTVEAAIFDTPTIVPTFNPLIPEEYGRMFHEDWLRKHFRFLVQEDTVCLARAAEDLVPAVRRALSDRSWLAEGRRKIRENVLGPLDGKATQRLASAAVEGARRGRARRSERH
ncbi:MAG: hypothetical protein HY825_05870 [Acidobacteria bacterium]|nr:hypothetical protein [Acidobacteriota bacterium]